MITGATPVIDWAYVIFFVAGLAVMWLGLCLAALLARRILRTRFGWRLADALRAPRWRRQLPAKLEEWRPLLSEPHRHNFRGCEQLMHGQRVYLCSCGARWRPATGERRPK